MRDDGNTRRNDDKLCEEIKIVYEKMKVNSAGMKIKLG